MKNFRKALSLLLVAAMLFSLGITALAADDAVSLDGKLVILHTNDTHGAISGYAQLSALKADYEAQGADVILVDAGDFIQGTNYVSLSQGTSAVELMNLAGYDVVTLGNHEFDYGYESLKTVLEAAEFQVTAANVSYEGAPAFAENVVIQTESGVKLGFFGLVTPEAQTKAHPAKIKGVSFDAAQAMFDDAAAQVKALKDAGCQLIVCVGHLGVDDESTGSRSIDLLAAVEGIDLFIDGHSHTVIDGGSSEYQTGGTMLVSTGSSFENIGAVVYDGETLTASLIPTSVQDEEGNVTSRLPDDELVKSAADAITAQIDELYSQSFATSAVALCGERDPGNRTMETNLGDLITDAMLWKAGELGLTVDAALTNGGGIRASIEAGEVTMASINTVLPFGNTLCLVEVTGAELLEALEASTFCTPTAVGAFPQVSGIELSVNTYAAYAEGELYPGSTYAAPAAPGSRVTIRSVGGEAFDPAATYTLATNDFLAAGGDTYYVFSASPYIYDLGEPLDEVVTDYITDVLGGVIGDEYAAPKGRISVLARFSDVELGQWYTEAIGFGCRNGFFKGDENNMFNLNSTMTVAECLTVLYRICDLMELELPQHDSTGENWMDAANYLAQRLNIAGQVDMDAPVTRLQASVISAGIISDYCAYYGRSAVAHDVAPFTDEADIDAEYLEALNIFHAIGGINGYEDGSFRPDETILRCEAAMLFYNMLESIQLVDAAA